MQLPGWPVRTWENMLVITWDLGADDLWCAADIKIVKSFAVRIHPPSFGPWPVFWFFLFLLFDLCLFMLSCMDCWWKINGDGHANLPQHQALQILGGNSLCITTVERSQNAAASATSTPGLKKNKAVFGWRVQLGWDGFDPVGLVFGLRFMWVGFNPIHAA